MTKYQKNLAEWVSLGFISQDQASLIIAHEEAKPESSWLMNGLLTLGVTILGIGIISIIAANWYQIPDFIKIVSDFLLLGTLAFYTFRLWESRNINLFEILLFGFMFMCLASIGLISQVYHTGGKLHQALLMWSVITFPIVLSARRYFIPFIWMGVLLSSIFLMLLDSNIFRLYYQNQYVSICLILCFFSGVMTIVSHHLSDESGQTHAFRYWTIIAVYIVLGSIEVYGVDRINLTEFSIETYYPSYILFAGVIFGIIRTNIFKPIQKYVLLGAATLLLLYSHFVIWNVRGDIIYAGFTILILSLGSVLLASFHNKRLFNSMLSVIGVRFLILYFQALGGLATTGFGLILSGGIVIGSAILWNKNKQKVMNWIERKVQ